MQSVQVELYFSLKGSKQRMRRMVPYLRSVIQFVDSDWEVLEAIISLVTGSIGALLHIISTGLGRQLDADRIGSL